MAEGRDESFDSGMFQRKFIHCCITFICTPRTLITIDSCRLDFFVDMDVNDDILMGLMVRTSYFASCVTKK